jgi:hypothetical protein
MVLRNLFAALLLAISINAAHAASQWLNLPPTPTLPKAAQSGFAPVNGIRLWYAVFGRGEPVILLQRHYQVIVWTAAATGAAATIRSPMATI